jgi:phage tail-like protein
MPEFVVNNQRVDPYKNFKFRVIWDSQYIPGILRVSPLKRTTEVIAQRKGSEQSTERRSPGLSRYEPVVIERGITQSRDFEVWAQKVWNLGLSMGAESSQDFRKDIVIEMYNESGQLRPPVPAASVLAIRVPGAAAARCGGQFHSYRIVDAGK